jgi:hypothetical protein
MVGKNRRLFKGGQRIDTIVLGGPPRMARPDHGWEQLHRFIRGPALPSVGVYLKKSQSVLLATSTIPDPCFAWEGPAGAGPRRAPRVGQASPIRYTVARLSRSRAVAEFARIQMIESQLNSCEFSYEKHKPAVDTVRGVRIRAPCAMVRRTCQAARRRRVPAVRPFLAWVRSTPNGLAGDSHARAARD